jgi:hypothetical protein
MRQVGDQAEPVPELGTPVRKPTVDGRPEWRAVPDKPHLEENAQGQVRTKLPLPPP